MWEFFHIYLWTQQHKLFRFFNHVLLTRVHYGTRIYACKPCTVYTIYIYMYKVYYGRSWYVVLSVKSRELPGLYILPIQATKAMISGRPSPQTSPPSLLHQHSIAPSFLCPSLPLQYSSHLSIFTLSTHPAYPSLLSSTHPYPPVLNPPIHPSSPLLIPSIYLSIYAIQYSSTYLSKPSSTHPLYLSIYTIPSGAHPVYLSIYQSIPSSLSI